MIGKKIKIILAVFWVSSMVFGEINAIDNKNNHNRTSKEGFKPNKTQIKPFVYKGKKAKEGQFPFMAVILSKETHCGGTILTPEYILTAGHCVVEDNMILRTNFTLLFGQVEKLENNSDWIVRKSDKAILHEDYFYDGMIFRNDLAIIVLNEELVFGPTIQPVQLPTESHKKINKRKFTAIGWGLTETLKISDSLMYTNLRGIKNKRCEWLFKKNLGESLKLDKGMVCMRKKGTGICPGDSGSPLVAKGTNILIGIANWGPFRCEQAPIVNGFARVLYYKDWIKSKIGETETI